MSVGIIPTSGNLMIQQGITTQNGEKWEVFSFKEGVLDAPSVSHQLSDGGLIELRGNTDTPIVINRRQLVSLRRSLVEAMLRYARGGEATYVFPFFQIQLNQLAEAVVMFNPSTRWNGPLTMFEGIDNIELLMYSLLQI